MNLFDPLIPQICFPLPHFPLALTTQHRYNRGTMHWLIDGHNLIGHMPNLRLDDPNDEQILLQYLRRYRAKTGHNITVIFDPGHGYRPGQTKNMGGITIQFVSSRKTADQIIMRRIRKIKNPQATIIVSSDRAVQQAAQQAQIRVMGSEDFAQQLLPGSPAQPDQDEGEQADISLSPDEVDQWLALFDQRDSYE